MDVIIPTNLVHVLFDPSIPTSSLNFIAFFILVILLSDSSSQRLFFTSASAHGVGEMTSKLTRFLATGLIILVDT